MPGNCGAFDSTFDRQGEVIHLPVEDLSRASGRVFTTKMAPQCRAFTGLCIEKKLKSPLFTRPVEDILTNYWCIILHSVSITGGRGGRGGAAVLRWRKASVGLGHLTQKHCETTANP